MKKHVKFTPQAQLNLIGKDLWTNVVQELAARGMSGYAEQVKPILSTALGKAIMTLNQNGIFVTGDGDFPFVQQVMNQFPQYAQQVPVHNIGQQPPMQQQNTAPVAPPPPPPPPGFVPNAGNSGVPIQNEQIGF